jgi:phosphoribosylformylglycinamidine synthase
MKNESTKGGVKISVPPTLLVSALGRIDDVRDSITLQPRQAGDAVYLLGTTREETGASEYFRYLGEREGRRSPLGAARPYVGSKVPRLRLDETVPLYLALHGAIRDGLVRSATTPGKGGWAIALARCVMAARVGLELDLDGCADLAGLEPDAALFSESNGRFLVTVARADAAEFERRFVELPCRRVGSVCAESRLRVRLGDRTRLDLEADALRAAFKETLRDE